jgi:Fe2+ transport system protein FeoA
MGCSNGPIYVCPNCKIGSEDDETFGMCGGFDVNGHVYMVCGKCGVISKGHMRLVIEIEQSTINKKLSKKLVAMGIDEGWNVEELDKILENKNITIKTIKVNDYESKN